MKIGSIIFLLAFLLPVTLKAQSKKTAPKAGNTLQASVSRGKKIYTAYCLACHQADGSGVPHLNPPLTATEWVSGPKPVLIQMILKGSKGKVEIDGDTFTNAMPAQTFLTDQQIADVLTYVRNAFGNKASAVTPAEVKAQRAKK